MSGRAPSGGKPRVDTPGVGVLVKVDAILELLESTPSGAGPTEVAESLGMSKSTAFRLLSGLEETGLVDANKEGRYTLGLRLLRLGHKVQSRLRVRDLALPSLERLADETGLTTFLCARDGHDAVCLEAIPGRYVDILELRPGGRLPAYAGGAGQVMLLAMTDAEFESYLKSAPFPARTSNTLIEAGQLRAARQDAMLRGYCVSREDVTLGIGAVAAPVRDVSGAVTAAISVAGLVSDIDASGTKKLAARVLEEARRVSQDMGFSG